MLLFWSDDVTPTNDVAAVRFQDPVKVNSLRIVPAGVAPFSELPMELGRTYPDRISLRVYIHVQPSSGSGKPKATNSLVCANIEYDGTLCDFPIEMEDVSTRLMVFEGSFQCMSLAIYGRPESDSPLISALSPTPPPQYYPLDLPIINPKRITCRLDVAFLDPPVSLANSFLAQYHQQVTLEDIARRLVSLPIQDDAHVNGDVSIPNVAACLALETGDDDWLSSAVLAAQSQSMSRVPTDADAFISRIHDCIGPKEGSTTVLQRRFFFEFLRYFSCQPDYVLLNFLRPGGIGNYFEGHAISSISLQLLLESVANPHVAQVIRDDPVVVDCLTTIQQSPLFPQDAKALALRIIRRSKSWIAFDAVVSADETVAATLPSSVIHQAFEWLEDLVADPQAFGVFALCVQTHFSNSSTRTTPKIPNVRELRADPTVEGVHSWCRAYQGVLNVALVLLWAVTESNIPLVRHVLDVFRLWCSSDYKEVAGLTLCQPAILSYLEGFRESSLASDEVDLIKDLLGVVGFFPSLPHRLYPADKTVLRASLDASSRSLKELCVELRSLEYSDAFPRARSSLVVAANALMSLENPDNGSNSAYDFEATGLMHDVLEITTYVIPALQEIASFPPVRPDHLVNWSQLFDVSILSLNILRYLLSFNPLTQKTRISIVHFSLVTYLFSRTPAINRRFEEYTSILIETSSQTICSLIANDSSVAALASQTLKNIFEFPIICPFMFAHTSEQILDLLDLVIDEPTSDDQALIWSRRFVGVLPELHVYLQSLGAEYRSKALKRFILMDDSLLGVGEWLVAAECRAIKDAAFSLRNVSDETSITLLVYAIDGSAGSLSRVANDESVKDDIFASNAVSEPLGLGLDALLEKNIYIPSVSQLVATFASPTFLLGPRFVVSGSLVLLRETRVNSPQLPIPKILHSVQMLLKKSQSTFNPGTVQRICLELGPALSFIAVHEDGIYQFDGAELEATESILALLRWAYDCSLEGQPQLAGLSPTSYQALCDIVRMVATSEQTSILDMLRDRIIFGDNAIPLLSYMSPITTLTTSLSALRGVYEPSPTNSPPRTPPPRTIALQDTFGVVTTLMSPPILRSPVNQGPLLQKKYSQNEFRQIRTSPSSASRPPSTHVDAFEDASLSPGQQWNPSSPNIGLLSPNLVYRPL